MRWRQLTDDVAVMQYPQRGFGIDFARNTTLLRLHDGRVVVHSSAPFSDEDVAAMQCFGDPAWLVDATLMHDTFAKEARRALPGVPYLAPEGFTKASGVRTGPLIPVPADWQSEIEVLPIEELRWTHEHAFFHCRSRTLVVCDLIFHFSSETHGWARFFIRHFMRLPQFCGVSAFFRLTIRDRELFAASMRRILQWDFTRIVVAHREPILDAAREKFEHALRDLLEQADQSQLRLG